MDDLMDSEVDYILLEWTFTPADFFEEPAVVPRNGYEFHIEAGRVEVRLETDSPPLSEDRYEGIHQDLLYYFIGAQLMNIRVFNLSQAPLITTVYRDGRRGVDVKVGAGHAIAAGGRVDFVVRDRDGRVVVDTRSARINRRKELAELTARYIPEFPELWQIIERYKLALENPAEEFIYLYEVREAIKKWIGNEQKTRTHLKISHTRWQDFGKLTNDAPVRQGRHRGVHLDHLRDATEQEIELARAFAADLIVRYIKYRAGLDVDKAE